MESKKTNYLTDVRIWMIIAGVVLLLCMVSLNFPVG